MFKIYLNKLKKLVNRNIKSSISLDLPFSQYSSDDKPGVESYANNSIVHRCISLIASSAGHIPWQVYKNHGECKKLLPTHPAANLLKHPNPETSGADFFVENISNLLLYGNSYIFCPKNTYSFQLHNLHPDLIEHIYNNGTLVGYKYQFSSETKMFYINSTTRMSQIMHFKNYNPMDNQKGLSIISSAKNAIDLHENIISWNKSLLKNAIRPSGALIFQNSDGYLTKDQFRSLQQQFYDNFGGSVNSGKPLMLEGGLKWQETNNVSRFEKFIELKDSTARDIATACNVPPPLLGLNGDNTYSNMQEARFALWEENIIPLLDKYADALSSWLSYLYDEELIIDFDRESISVLTKRREYLWSKISKANFMTMNEKRTLVGLDPIKGGDKIKISGAA